MKWLLLRGLNREQRHWGDFLPYFESQMPGHTAHCLDLPGVGTEHTRPSPTNVAGIVHDLRARLASMRSDDEPWSIVGVSLAGMVALEWCKQFQRDFERAVVINTSAADAGSVLERFRPIGFATALKTVREKDTVRRERVTIDTIINSGQIDRDELAQEWARYQQDAPVSRSLAANQIKAGLMWRAPKSISVPLLVLASHGDKLVSAVCSRRLAERYHAPLAIHATGGHDLARDDPGWVVGQIKLWACEQ